MRCILYAEIPCFYAAVERNDDPALQARPVIVGGDPRKRGRVQAASPDALAAGVEVGMPMIQALERCPAARAVKTNMKRYREVSGLFRASLRRVVDSLEPMSLEAAYLDPSPLAPEEKPEEIAWQLQESVKQELGLPLRVGIAAVKFLAKLAAEEAPCDGVRRVRIGEEAAFLAPLPLCRLPGVGPKTLATLAEFGATTVGELLAIPAVEIEARLGNHGLRILEYARGEDSAPIRAARHPNTVSQEYTFQEPQVDLSLLDERLQRLCSGLEASLRRQGLLARRIAIKVRYADSETVTRSRTLGRPIGLAGEMHHVASELIERTHAGTRAIRLLGVALSGLSPMGRSDGQLELFSGPS
jgi:DNA polymerase-4